MRLTKMIHKKSSQLWFIKITHKNDSQKWDSQKWDSQKFIHKKETPKNYSEKWDSQKWLTKMIQKNDSHC